jgi:hypothetical protein
MTQDEIIEMARESGCEIRNGHIYNQYTGSLDQMLKHFAKLVAAKEREACAVIADGWPDYNVQGLAEAIRAKGQGTPERGQA